MEAETLTATVDNKQQGSGSNPQRENAPKNNAPALAVEAAAMAKEAKSAPERKRTRNLSEDKRFKLFSGTANRPLTEEIGRHIGVPVGESKIQRFADGEVYFQLLENVRGVDVFVVQPTCYPVDQNLVELLVMIDALKRASAARITVVVPYYGYARTAKTVPVWPSAPSWLPIYSPQRAPIVPFSSTCTPPKSRVSSTFPSITSTPARCWSATSASLRCPT